MTKNFKPSHRPASAKRASSHWTWRGAALHDEAGLRHCGEAEAIGERYRVLPLDDRRALLAFLDSL